MLNVPARPLLQELSAPAASCLPARRAEANCFYEAALFDAARAAFDPDGDIRLLDVTGADGDVIARLPVVASRRHGRFPVAHCANWVHRHCYYGAPLLAPGQEAEGWRGLLGLLDDAPWSGAFLHLRLIDRDGPAARILRSVCAADGRDLIEIARYERALLHSDLSAEDYWTQTVRSKKRKELRRLQHRLEECGAIRHAVLADAADLSRWCDDFLALEGSGWKGAEGTALGSTPADRLFFRTACTRAFAVGALDMLRIDCDGRAIAMLVNFVGPDGGFSFKIAIDEGFARYSPGVLIEIDNLARVLDAGRAPWMDSCAAAGHPMIDSLWGERRTIVQYRIALRPRGPRALRAELARCAVDSAEHLARLFRTRMPA